VTIPLFIATTLFTALAGCGIILPLVAWRILFDRGITASLWPGVKVLCDVLLIFAFFAISSASIVLLYKGSGTLYVIRDTTSGNATRRASILLFAPSLAYEFADGSSVQVQRQQKDVSIIINDSSQALRLSHHQYSQQPSAYNSNLESPVKIPPHGVYHATFGVQYFGQQGAPEVVWVRRGNMNDERYSLEYQSLASENPTEFTRALPMLFGLGVVYLVLFACIRYVNNCANTSRRTPGR
jgi:hypothetical protein